MGEALHKPIPRPSVICSPLPNVVIVGFIARSRLLFRLDKVILVNDDFTPREIVVRVRKAEFRMTECQALE